MTRCGDVEEEEEEIEEQEEEDGRQLEEWDGRTTVEIPIIREDNTEEGEETRKKRRRRQRMADFVLGRMKKRICQAGALLARLRQVYRFPRDRAEEKYLFQKIVNACAERKS